jgi:dTDP-L-rhamnose 4-epimerase
MSICLVGGEGFIGKAVQKDLHSHSRPYQVFDSLDPKIHGSAARNSVNSCMKVDFREISVVRNISFKEFDEVFFLVAETSTGNSLEEMRLHIETGLISIANMLRVFDEQQYRPKRIMLTSSRAVYGEGMHLNSSGRLEPNPTRTLSFLERGLWENSPSKYFVAHNPSLTPNPVSVYGEIKLAQERLMTRWCEARNIKLDIYRLQNVVGPGQTSKNPYTGFLTQFIKIALEGGEIELYEEGGVVRDLVHVDDVARAICCTGKNFFGTSIYDIGSGIPITLETIAKNVVSRNPGARICSTRKFRLGDVRRAYANISFAKSTLEWEPRYNLDRILFDAESWIVGELRIGFTID